jgi:trimeric autotransporter adhesin
MKSQTQLVNVVDPHSKSLHSQWQRSNLVLALVTSWFMLLPITQAVEPPPDGGYANFNTAEGQDALFSLTSGAGNTALGFTALYHTTTGEDNTAVGFNALLRDTTGSFNTATGANALYNTTTGGSNTATGYDALGLDTTGSYNTATGSEALEKNTTASYNTATGYFALNSNSTGTSNTADGANALRSNTTGSRNVATGSSALYSNQTGGDNTATGVNALYANTGNYNTATGYQALESNTTGSNNTAHGLNALNTNTTGSNNTANGASTLFYNLGGTGNTAEGYLALHENTSGINNTALGTSALYGNTTGGTNIAIGLGAGFFLTTGSNNIDIGNMGVAGEAGIIRIGTAGTQNATYIAGIKGVPVTGGQVAISSTGQLGIRTSSARFKKQIKPMEKASEAIFYLEPVTFQYKPELDPEGSVQFGLVAEQVAEVDRNLVTRDEQGKPYTVRYEEINAMLLNEFLKEHSKGQEQERRVDKLEATLAQLESLLSQQNAQIQKWRKLTAGKTPPASDANSSLAAR